jgi:hypothetical protein
MQVPLKCSFLSSSWHLKSKNFQGWTLLGESNFISTKVLKYTWRHNLTNYLSFDVIRILKVSMVEEL